MPRDEQVRVFKETRIYAKTARQLGISSATVKNTIREHAPELADLLLHPSTRGKHMSPTCRVKGCERPSKKNGYCSMHYNRLVKTGEVGPPEPLVPPKVPVELQLQAFRETGRFAHAAKQLGIGASTVRRTVRKHDPSLLALMRHPVPGKNANGQELTFEQWRAIQQAKICQAEGCKRRVGDKGGQGYCRLHYGRLKRTGEVGPPEKLPSHKLKVPVETVLLVFEENRCYSETARTLHIGASSVWRIVNKHAPELAATLRYTTKGQPRFTAEQTQGICERYKAGEGFKSLTRAFHRSHKAIRQLLVDNNIPIRDPLCRISTATEKAFDRTKAKEPQVKKLLLQGHSVGEIRRTMKMARETINAICERNGWTDLARRNGEAKLKGKQECMRSVSPERLRVARQMQERGHTYAEIAETLGVSDRTVYVWLKSVGLTIRKDRYTPQRREQVIAAQRLKKQGWSYEKIGTELGVRGWTISRWLKDPDRWMNDPADQPAERNKTMPPGMIQATRQ